MMKKFLFLALLPFIIVMSFSKSEAQNNPFITKWEAPSNGELTIPTTGTGTGYDIAWYNETNAGIGNGSASGQTGNYTITGLTSGDTFRIEITGDLEKIQFNNSGDKDYIKEISQWGDIAWTNMTGAFYGCKNLSGNPIDTPNLSAVTTMSNMFRGATAFNGDISGWDVSNVTIMNGMFWDATTFNGDISGWDVSNVTNMNGMFVIATAFNGDISGWDVGKVTNMGYMFYRATAFNGDLSTWNVDNVTNMNGMFVIATAFNGDISGWNVSNVTDMANMFYGATAFNGDISGWDVSNVTNMGLMFFGATAFNQDLGSWELNDNLGNIGFNGSGMDCNNYSLTLHGWAENSNTPDSVTLDASGINYSPR